jgi:hypothetical protein
LRWPAERQRLSSHILSPSTMAFFWRLQKTSGKV